MPHGTAVPSYTLPAYGTGCMEDQQFKHVILTALEYSYLHDDWVNPLSEALDGVTAEEALWRPGRDSKGIWDIVLHLAVGHEDVIDRMRSGDKSRPAEGHWPPPPEVADETNWRAAQNRLWDSLAALRSY